MVSWIYLSEIFGSFVHPDVGGERMIEQSNQIRNLDRLKKKK